MRQALIIATLLLTGLGTPATAQTRQCSDGTCRVQLTPEQLLGAAEKLVAMRRFDEATPLIEALRMAPGYSVQTRFLTGFIAGEKGDYARAAEQYKAILEDSPGQTRVRLELGRAMMAMGKVQSADKQFRLAGQDEDLPPDIARAIRGVRAVIRQQRAWRFDIDFGIAPDSNINNATAANQVTVNLGDYSLPLALDENARARSGTGQTATISAGLRLPVGTNTSMLLDLDSNGSNYSGSANDDYLVQMAAGPELRLSRNLSVSAQGVAAQRWYGGRLATRQLGAKMGAQASLGMRDRAGLQLDVRHTDASFSEDYNGWQVGFYGSYEHAISKALVISTGGFARRDALKEQAYSNSEAGITAGMGGELPLGINFGVSGSFSRAVYDAPMLIFSNDSRKDWRVSARATLGNRKVRVFGFSPEASLSYARSQSNIPFFTTDRLRFRMALARYF